MLEPKKERPARPRRRGGGRSREGRSQKRSDGDVQAAVNPKDALRELFPDWADDDLETVLADSQGELEEAVQRITDGRAQQWGRVTSRKQRKEEQASTSVALEAPPREHSRREHDHERKQKPKKKPQVPNGTQKSVPSAPAGTKAPPLTASASNQSANSRASKTSQSKPLAGGNLSWAEMLSRPKVPEPVVEQQPSLEQEVVEPTASSVDDGVAQEPLQQEFTTAQRNTSVPESQDQTESKKPSVPNGAVSWAAALSANKQAKAADKPAAKSDSSTQPAADQQTSENASSENEKFRQRRRRGGQRQKKSAEPEIKNGDTGAEHVSIQFGSFGFSEEPQKTVAGGAVEIKAQSKLPEVPIGPRGSALRQPQNPTSIPRAPAVPPSIAPQVPQVPQVPPAIPPSVPQVPLSSFSHPPHAEIHSAADSVQTPYGDMPYDVSSQYGYGVGYPPRYNYGDYGGYDLAAQQFYYPPQMAQVPQAPAAGTKSSSSGASPMPFAHPAPYFMPPSAYYYGYPGYGSGMMPPPPQSPAPGHPQQPPGAAQTPAQGPGQGQPNKNSPYFWQYGQ